MITKDQADMLKALIRVYRTRAVRYVITERGTGGPGETVENTYRTYRKAEIELQGYIDSLKEYS